MDHFAVSLARWARADLSEREQSSRGNLNATGTGSATPTRPQLGPEAFFADDVHVHASALVRPSVRQLWSIQIL